MCALGSNTSADVVVIGGGIVGTSVAYHMAKAGLKKVVVLERGALCSGTSSHCAATLQIQTKTPGPKLALAQESLALYAGLGEELGCVLPPRDCDLEIQKEGGIIVAFTEEEERFLKHKADDLRGQGVNIAYLAPDDLRAVQPNISPNVLGGLWCPDDWITNPFRVTYGFARAAQRLGVEVREGTEVRGIRTDGRKVVGVETGTGALATGLVVNAAGVWSPEVAQMVGLSLPVAPRRGQMVVTEPMHKLVRGVALAASYLLSKKMPSTDDGGAAALLGGAVFFQSLSGNIIAGSTREFVGMNWNTTLAGIREVVRQVSAVIPAVAQANVIRTFAGLRPAAPDGLPIIDRHPDLDGFILATGHEGDGVSLAPITGHKVAGIVTGRILWEDLAPFSLSRFAEG